MGNRMLEQTYFVVENSLKNLYRYRKRCVMFGIILLFLASAFVSAIGVYCTDGISEKNADFALRFAWVSGILWVVMLDTLLRLTIAVRRKEISVIYMLGIDTMVFMITLWLEFEVISVILWLLATVIGGIIAGNVVLCCLLIGPLLMGILTFIRLMITYIASKRKLPADFMKEGK